MRKDELIRALANIPGNPVVALLDTNIHTASLVGDNSGEGSSEGIYPDFEVEPMQGSKIPKGAKPWIAINFTPETE